MTRSSWCLPLLASLLAIPASIACGRVSDRTGDETHFQTCRTGLDCRATGSSYTCQQGICRPSSVSDASSSGQGGGTGGVAIINASGGSASSNAGGSGNVVDASANRTPALDGAPRATADADGRMDSGPRDAMSSSDGGPTLGTLGTEITPDEVLCGAIPPCQSPIIKCCSATFSASGGGCGLTSAVCSSNISLECDGPEDCTTGLCFGEPYGGGVETQCTSTTGTFRICHNHTQCPAQAPNCCPLWTDRFTPYLGECDSRTTFSGFACDTP
jgi:hypothetical protein